MAIAIRVWHWPHWAMFEGGGLSGAPRIGNSDQLNAWMTLEDRNTFWALSAQDYLALLNFLYFAAGFLLLLMRPKERLYLWYGLAGLFFCGWSLMRVFSAFHDVPALVNVDRANKFYGSFGWRRVAGFRFDNGFRVVQYTPRLGIRNSVRLEDHNNGTQDPRVVGTS